MSEEDRIRRLLADARHDEPIPPDVAARLDGVLADLRADRPVPATVTDLAAARRRRRVRTLLVAAAAVVVAGIGVDQFLGATQSGSSDSGAGSGADSAVTGAEEAPQPLDGAGGGGVTHDGLRSLDGRLVRLDSDRFAPQVTRLQAGRTAAYDAGEGDLDMSKAVRCHRPGPGHAVSVTYDGAPGVLVFRPPSRDSQVVDLILCGHPGITRTITLPAP